MARPINTARKEEILKMSLKVFSKNSSWDISLNEIARQLKTSTRMLVHHYQTREKLVSACRLKLKEKLAQKHLRSEGTLSWSRELLQQWSEALLPEQSSSHRLYEVSRLQIRGRSFQQQRISAIEDLRELLPSRLKKFAEEIHSMGHGLRLDVLAGSAHDRAFKIFESYLKRIEKQL